jgi:hypothetical protein
MLCFPYYVYVFSSTKLEIRKNRFCPEVRERGEERVREGTGGEMAQTM